MFDQLTDDELALTETRVYSGCMKLYRRTSELQSEMMQLPAGGPTYDKLHATARVMLAAAHEQYDLHDEIRDEQRDRAAAANAAACLADGARVVAAVDAAMAVVESHRA